MLDAVCALMGARFQQYFATGRDLPALGSGHPQATPWQTFEASDGAFVVTVNTDDLWRRLCEAMGLGPLGRDERLQTAAGRLRNRDEITAVLSREFREHPRAHWSKLLDQAGVPSGPVLSMSEVAAHPQVANNAIFPEVAGLPGMRTTRMPMRISSTAEQPVTAPPGLGTHSRTILADLGYSEPEIARLEAEGVIYAPQEDQ
jgi:formyl-CoA transferase